MWLEWPRSIPAPSPARSTSRRGRSSTRTRPSACSGPPSSSATGPTRSRAGLKTNRSFTVGVVIPDLTNPLFPPIMRGIEDRLAEAGYTALIVNTDNDADRERSQIAAMRARQVDGFIAATARLDHELLAEAGAGGTPLVLVNRSFEDGSVAGRHGRRPGGDTPGGRACGGARASTDRPSGRPAERLHRSSPLPRLPRRDARGRARGPRRLGQLHRGPDRVRGRAGLRRAPRASAARDRDRGRQRPAGDRLLRHARRSRVSAARRTSRSSASTTCRSSTGCDRR